MFSLLPRCHGLLAASGPTPAPVGVGSTPKSSANTSLSCSFSKVLQGPVEPKIVMAVSGY